MLWELEQGPTAKLIIEQAERSRVPIPDVIANRPRLLPGLEFYMRAFNDLCSERQIVSGMSAAMEGRIPWSKARDYAITWRLSAEEFSRLWELLTAMDSAYINHKGEAARRTASVENRKGAKGSGARERKDR